MKEGLKARVARGRITTSVDVEAEAGGNHLVVDEALAAEYGSVLATLAEKHGLQGAPTALDFAQLPDVVRRTTPTLEEDAVTAALDDALGQAMDQLDAMRDREGAALNADLTARLATIAGHLDSIQANSADSVERARDRLRERVAALLPDGVSPDPDRLATEVAIFAEKADITEELVRFRAHLEAFAGFLASSESVGKRLDFLLQEMNREANTIGSKSAVAEIAHLVVELKEEIERIREQVQNIE